MKRRPILFDKRMASRQGMAREVIGLIGTHHGAGATHTGLMLAFYMGEELGKKTAYLECNNHQDMELIQKAYEWSREDENSFSFHRITCVKQVSHARIAEIFSDNYECIIMDFGIDFEKSKEEFLRCGTKIVIGPRSQWNRQKLKRFCDMTETIHGSDTWLYFIPHANNNTITEIKSEVRKRVWTVPMNEEPTLLSRDISRFFRQIF